MRYRQAITGQVAEIIRSRCTRSEAVARLRQWAEESVIETDRKRFATTAEETLAGIHSGETSPDTRPGHRSSGRGWRVGNDDRDY